MEESLDTDPYEMEKYGFQVTRVKEYKSNQHVFLKRNLVKGYAITGIADTQNEKKQSIPAVLIR